MKKVLAAIAVSTFALGALSASAADMTSEERAALRERASALQAQRAQQGNQVRSDVNLANDRADVRVDKRSDVKKTKKAKKTAKHTKRHASTKAHSTKSEVTKTRAAR